MLTVECSVTIFFLFAGDVFNQFANWTEQDNNTGVYYETWTVRSKPGTLHYDGSNFYQINFEMMVMMMIVVVWWQFK